MSSDSEDDCYGNLTAKMQKFKEKFVEDKTETFNLLDDSTEIDEIVKNCPLPAKKGPEPKEVSDLPDVSVGGETAGCRKRMTRSAARKSNTATSSEVEMPPPPSSKRKKKQKTNDSDETANTSTSSDTTANNVDTTSRGGTSGRRGRGRGSRSRPSPRRRWGGGRMWMLARQRDFLADFFSAIIPSFSGIDSGNPIFSVGNTDDYPDHSDDQKLFSNKNKEEKKDEVITLEDNDLGEDNEELSVKVYWQSAEFFKFNLRKFQKFTPVFDFFAKKENVTSDKLLLTYNDIIIKPDDTPDSIGYSIVKFIDGGIVTQGVNNLTSRNKEIKDGITIKFQCQNQKKPFELAVCPDDKMSLAMMKCSEHFELPLEKLRFEFDGDSISGKCTARDMELEGGECIDIRILN